MREQERERQTDRNRERHIKCKTPSRRIFFLRTFSRSQSAALDRQKDKTNYSANEMSTDQGVLLIALQNE